MIANYYSLLRVAREMKSLVGMKIIECFSQEKDSVVFSFFAGEEVKYVFFSAKPNSAIIYIDERFTRAKKNSVDLMPYLLGDILQSVELMPDDRVMVFNFTQYKLIFQLFAGASANLLLCNLNRKVVYALNNVESNIYEPSETNLQSFNEFLGSEKLLPSLSKCDLLLGKHYAEELLTRLNLPSDAIIADLTENQKIEIFKEAENLIHSLTFGKNVYILQSSAEPLFSLIKLQKMPEVLHESESVSKTLKRARIMKMRYKIENTLRREILPSLVSEKKRIGKKIEDCRNIDEITERVASYNLIGSLLLSQANPKAKLGESIELTGYSGEKVIAKLDPKLDLVRNAEKYFSRAKKSIRDGKIKAERLPIYEKKYAEICQLIEQYESTDDLDNLKKLKINLSKKKIGKKMEYINRTPDEKFKTFDLGDGFTLYVGKNAANNDELTMKFAKPNDLWLHARGTSGSHAVLPLKGLDKAPKNILIKAAGITAYYSSARNGKFVPVCYTLKKNVRKPKGANPGAVVVSREEVIMVEPVSVGSEPDVR